MPDLQLNTAGITVKLNGKIKKQGLSDGVKKPNFLYMIYKRYTLNVNTYRNEVCINIELPTEIK